MAKAKKKSSTPTTWPAEADKARRPPYFGEREPVTYFIGAHLGPRKTGRHENFGVAVAEELKADLEAYVLEQKATTGRDVFRKKADSFVQERLKARGLASSDRIVRRQIVTPVYKKLGLGRAKKRPKRSGPK
jgi:hypothetical protein